MRLNGGGRRPRTLGGDGNEGVVEHRVPSGAGASSASGARGANRGHVGEYVDVPVSGGVEGGVEGGNRGGAGRGNGRGAQTGVGGVRAGCFGAFSTLRASDFRGSAERAGPERSVGARFGVPLSFP